MRGVSDLIDLLHVTMSDLSDLIALLTCTERSVGANWSDSSSYMYVMRGVFDLIDLLHVTMSDLSDLIVLLTCNERSV
jgi:hypothetical protein